MDGKGDTVTRTAIDPIRPPGGSRGCEFEGARGGDSNFESIRWRVRGVMLQSGGILRLEAEAGHLKGGAGGAWSRLNWHEPGAEPGLPGVRHQRILASVPTGAAKPKVGGLQGLVERWI